jgi:hypothetical protein
MAEALTAAYQVGDHGDASAGKKKADLETRGFHVGSTRQGAPGQCPRALQLIFEVN